MKLMARREAGETLTQNDMDAIVAASIENDEFMRERYMEFIKADSHYRNMKVDYDAAVRDYWENRPHR
jgi:hypothetical protein